MNISSVNHKMERYDDTSSDESDLLIPEDRILRALREKGITIMLFKNNEANIIIDGPYTSVNYNISPNFNLDSDSLYFESIEGDTYIWIYKLFEDYPEVKHILANHQNKDVTS